MLLHHHRTKHLIPPSEGRKVKFNGIIHILINRTHAGYIPQQQKRIDLSYKVEKS